MKGGWKSAAHDVEAAELLFSMWPGKNIALVLPEHICVLDVDPRNGGEEALRAWEEEHGDLPETAMSRTGGGGKHLYFRCDPTRKLRTSLGAGLDLIGQGHQLTEAPSVTVAPYKWVIELGEYGESPDGFYAPKEVARPATTPNGHGSNQPDDSIRKYCWTALANEKQRLATTLTGGRNAALNNAALALGHLAHYHAYGIDEARIALRAACQDNGLLGNDGEQAFATTFASGWAKGEQEPTFIEPGIRIARQQAYDERNPPPAQPPAKAVRKPVVKFSAAHLDTMEFPPVQWIIEGILPTGLTILAGKSKIGKSWLAMDLALSVAVGAPALSKINSIACRVLYVALEDPERRLQSRMRKLASEGLAPESLVFANEWPIVGQGCLEEVEAHLDQEPGCKLIIIDTFGKVRGRPDGRSTLYQQDYQDMGEFHSLATRRNIALLLIHHTRKQDATDVMDLISGSTGIVGAADTLMVLQRKRGQNDGTFDVTGRDIVDDGTFAVTFSKDTGKWTMLGPAKEHEQETAQSAVYNFILSQTDPIGPTDLASELEMPLQTVKTALRRLKKRGSIKQAARGLWIVEDGKTPPDELPL